MSSVLQRACALSVQYAAVGSRVTCDPAPQDGDEDWLLLVREWGALDALLSENGWKIDGSRVSDEVNIIPMDQRFYSLSKDGVNVIYTKSAKFFERFLAASSVAKRLNLLKKSDRIALFQAVLYGNPDIENAIPGNIP